MAEPGTQPARFHWKLLLYAAIGAIISTLILSACAQDPTLIYIFLMVPAICLACLAWLIFFAVAALRRRPIPNPSMLVTAVAVLIVSGALLSAQNVLRPSLRWLLWSRRFKAEVLAQPARPNGELRHLEWDGWGGAPVGDWTAYIVFDPTDSLSAAADKRQASGYHRYKGIPCEVDAVRRLEAHWYSVVLGMNEWWERCG